MPSIRHIGGALSTDSFRQAIEEQSIEAHEDTILQARALGVSALPTLPNLNEALKETEQLFIGEALKRADGNQTVAAGLLGLIERCAAQAHKPHTNIIGRCVTRRWLFPPALSNLYQPSPSTRDHAF